MCGGIGEGVKVVEDVEVYGEGVEVQGRVWRYRGVEV